VWNGGTGFTGRWTDIQGEIAPGSLSDPTGTLATAGNHADGTSMKRQIDFLAGEYWLSYLMRRSGSLSGAQSSGLSIAGFRDFSGTYFIGEPGGGVGDNTLVIGSGDDNAYVSSGVPFEPGRDYLIVAHIGLVEGNDIATLYVNPTPGAAEPTGGVTFTGTDFIPDLATFSFVSQGEAVASFDELRVGTTYAEVAPLVSDPTVPEPGIGLGLFGALLTLAQRPRRGMSLTLPIP
jgi:hypothetical protein